MSNKSILETAHKIVNTIANLKSSQGYHSDPYEKIFEKYKMIVEIESSEKPDLEKLTPLLNWSKLYAYRIVFEAPIKCYAWDELLMEIDFFNSLI